MKPAIIRPDLELKKEIREVPARNVIYIRLFGDYKMNDYGGTWMRLFQFIKEEKLPMGDMAPYCMYHDDPKVTPADKLRTDVCMVMPVTVPAAAFTAPILMVMASPPSNQLLTSEYDSDASDFLNVLASITLAPLLVVAVTFTIIDSTFSSSMLR